MHAARQETDTMDRATFKQCVSENIVLIGQALKNEFVIPEWRVFCSTIEKIYVEAKSNTDGKVANYIPQLSRYRPNYWGVSVCTVDGQRYSIGDTNVPFCLQSCSKALTYAIACTEKGADHVHKYVGQEPSGRSFNELSLDHNKKPHNPMINAGGILTTAMIEPHLKPADRFDFIMNEYQRMAGGDFIGFSNATYLSEKDTADRNFALSYYMRENKCFPEGASLQETLELYFQLCSIEVTVDSGAVMAATLANGGICPTTGDAILDNDAARNTLSLMHSCGMYDYSGQFAFKIGLPAKSGVGGGILLVVPNVCGIMTWSPPLDELGNSCRGLQFCEGLVSNFNFHNYDNLNYHGNTKKMDPRQRRADLKVQYCRFSTYQHCLHSFQRYTMQGLNMSLSDYDGRTALHLGAAEGHLDVVEFLMKRCKLDPCPRDRWGFTPMDDAVRFNRQEVISFLETYHTPINEKGDEKNEDELRH
ncbi:glutaminase kidney isoform, mitochondrial-like [Saccoglossus kowalevskii]